MKNIIWDEVKLEVNSLRFWFDSKIVIKWLKNETTNFDFYTAHLVNENEEISSIEDWHYVATVLNVAYNLTILQVSRIWQIIQSSVKVHSLLCKIILNHSSWI